MKKKFPKGINLTNPLNGIPPVPSSEGRNDSISSLLPINKWKENQNLFHVDNNLVLSNLTQNDSNPERKAIVPCPKFNLKKFIDSNNTIGIKIEAISSIEKQIISREATNHLENKNANYSCPERIIDAKSEIGKDSEISNKLINDSIHYSENFNNFNQNKYIQNENCNLEKRIQPEYLEKEITLEELKSQNVQNHKEIKEQNPIRYNTQQNINLQLIKDQNTKSNLEKENKRINFSSQNTEIKYSKNMVCSYANNLSINNMSQKSQSYPNQDRVQQFQEQKIEINSNNLSIINMCQNSQGYPSREVINQYLEQKLDSNANNLSINNMNQQSHGYPSPVVTNQYQEQKLDSNVNNLSINNMNENNQIYPKQELSQEFQELKIKSNANDLSINNMSQKSQEYPNQDVMSQFRQQKMDSDANQISISNMSLKSQRYSNQEVSQGFQNLKMESNANDLRINNKGHNSEGYPNQDLIQEYKEQKIDSDPSNLNINNLIQKGQGSSINELKQKFQEHKIGNNANNLNINNEIQKSQTDLNQDALQKECNFLINLKINKHFSNLGNQYDPNKHIDINNNFDSSFQEENIRESNNASSFNIRNSNFIDLESKDIQYDVLTHSNQIEPNSTNQVYNKNNASKEEVKINYNDSLRMMEGYLPTLQLRVNSENERKESVYSQNFLIPIRQNGIFQEEQNIFYKTKNNRTNDSTFPRLILKNQVELKGGDRKLIFPKFQSMNSNLKDILYTKQASMTIASNKPESRKDEINKQPTEKLYKGVVHYGPSQYI